MIKNKPVLVAALATSAAILVWDRTVGRRRKEALIERAEAAKAEHEAFLANLEDLHDRLGKQLETAKFWTIVTQPDE